MTEETPMTASEAADFLQISKSKLYQLLKAKKPPPCFMIGEQPRFLKSNLVTWLKKFPR